MRTGAARPGMGAQRQEGDLDLDATLAAMVESGASDLHLTSGAAPTVRHSGALRPLDGFPMMEAEALRRTLYGVLTQKQREKFEADLELDLSYSVRGLSRFRVNLYQQRESIGAAFRVIPYEIKPLEQLGVPPVVANFAGLPRGLVLVTGPTGSGKSTTLASIIDLANRTRPDHIMTVEDPIEFLHRHKKALINQREVGEDTHSFANALKHVLRQDPDIILVGEMRDLETISVALTAAETGHLVFATLHTQDAAQTIDRIIDVFPAHQQAQVRTQLAGAIQGVVCQALCKRADGQGRTVATEVMIATPAIRNLIREGKTHQIYSAMQAGAQQGMHTMDQQLAELVKSGRISYETGLEKCHHPEDFNRLTGRFGAASQIGQGGMPAQNAMYESYPAPAPPAPAPYAQPGRAI
jgi:twitching motility protein PilT